MTNPLLLNANTAVMARSTNFLLLLLPLATPITNRPHFIPRPTRSLPSLLLLTMHQHPNGHINFRLLFPPAIPIISRPHFIPHQTRFLSSLLLLTLFQHTNDHARTNLRLAQFKLLPFLKHPQTTQYQPLITHNNPRQSPRPPIPLARAPGPVDNERTGRNTKASSRSTFKTIRRG